SDTEPALPAISPAFPLVNPTTGNLPHPWAGTRWPADKMPPLRPTRHGPSLLLPERAELPRRWGAVQAPWRTLFSRHQNSFSTFPCDRGEHKGPCRQVPSQSVAESAERPGLAVFDRSTAIQPRRALGCRGGSWS